MTFSVALRYLGMLEGDYTVDDGGPTLCGVTQTAWDQYCQQKGMTSVPVRTLTNAQVADFYWFSYWKPLCLDEIPDGLDFVVFQWAINHEGAGDAGQAVRDLQICAGANPDGIMGPMTVKCVQTFAFPLKLASCVLDRQEAWYKEAASKNPALPLDGWLNRVRRCRAFLKMHETGESNVRP